MNGTIAVSGMALAKAMVLARQEVQAKAAPVADVQSELLLLEQAKAECIAQLSALMAQIQRASDQDFAEILDFQILLLEDVNYYGRIQSLIRNEQMDCRYAIHVCSENYRAELAALDNSYLNERVGDITDVENRLIRILTHKEGQPNMDGERIVVAEDLTPSQVVEMGRHGLRGIVLEKGGMSSHCVILARSMNIPCLIGAAGVLGQVETGKLILLDAVAGRVITAPTQTEIDRYQRYADMTRKEQAELEQYRRCETRTADGGRMRVYANISSAMETKALLDQGGEGVGLLRTEMLYMDRQDAPEEAAQYQCYRTIVKELGGRPLIVRTLDVGGDKHIPYLQIPAEENPFLGYRAIRYCLEHPEVFRVQIAAILRAAAEGPVQVMLPMITTLTEVAQAKAVIREVGEDLTRRGIPVGTVSLGMMVETPAAAVMADRFAEAVDFFSIGTNDLTQYLFAADRGNASVASLNSYFQPALLRMIDHVCRCAHAKGIEVDICGQAGEVEELIPLWVGMGVDNLSVSIPSIPRVRRAISRCDRGVCGKIVKEVLQLPHDGAVKEYIGREVKKWS